MGSSTFVVPSSGRRWRALALAAALAGGALVAHATRPDTCAHRPRVAAVVPVSLARPAPAPVVASAEPDGCRPALSAWAEGRRAPEADTALDARLRAERERAIDACLARR